MAVTYTNWRGVTYYLCRGVTKTGKPRYYFAREPKGEPVEQIPEGWRISESINGIVSLVKDRPAQIRPEEVEAVKAAVQQHPESHNYRVAVKCNRIEVYERVGLGPDELIADLREVGLLVPGRAGRLREMLEGRARFTAVLRFILADAEQRTFRTERWCYLGSIDDWIHVGPMGPVDRLARHWVPKLGTDALFEVVRPF
jgi:hypothetical protein